MAQGCTSCINSPDSATLHYDCTYIFQRNGSGQCNIPLMLLSSIATVPWPGCPPLWLPYRLPVSQSLHNLDRYSSLDFWHRLPLELRQTVLQHLDGSLYMRFTVAEQRARALASTPRPGSKRFSVPLRRVLSWHRGADPQITDPNTNFSGFVSITLDAEGLRAIEQLPQVTSPSSSAQRYHITLIEHTAKMANVKALFMASYPIPSPSIRF